MNKNIALLLAAALILLGIYFYRRNAAQKPVAAAIETQVDTTQDLAPEVAEVAVAVEQEAAQ